MDEHLIDKTLREIVSRIVQATHPIRIILFGSAARGEMKGHSDLDILVVVPSGTHRRHTAQMIYRKLFGVDLPVDIVVITEEDIELYKDNPGMVIKPALEDGRVIYAA